LAVNIGFVQGHEVFGIGEWLKTELLIELVSVLRRQQQSPQALQLGMFQHRARAASTAAAAMLRDEKVGM